MHGARRYYVTWVVLAGLAAASLGLAFVPLGGWDIAEALGIAGLKAVLVAAIFMHLADEPFVHGFMLTAAGALIALLVVLAAADVWTR